MIAIPIESCYLFLEKISPSNQMFFGVLKCDKMKHMTQCIKIYLTQMTNTVTPLSNTNGRSVSLLNNKYKILMEP